MRQGSQCRVEGFGCWGLTVSSSDGQPKKAMVAGFSRRASRIGFRVSGFQMFGCCVPVGVRAFELRTWALRLEILGLRIYGFGVEGLGFRVYGFGLWGLGVWGLRFPQTLTTKP